MEILSGIWDVGVPFVVILTVLVFVHELGHYWVAKRAGVRIEVFSIGFGPELFGFTDRSGTRWKISLVPLGGYVKMFGDADIMSRPAAEPGPAEPQAEVGGDVEDWASGHTRPLTEAERAVSFHHKSLMQRTAIVAAGPLANFLFAIVVLAGFFVFIGQPSTPPVVTEVLPDSAAAEAGLEAGDRILSINGQDIERFEEIQRIVQINLSEPLYVRLLRAGGQLDLQVRPRIVEVTDRFGNRYEMPRLGVKAEGTEFEQHGLVTSLWLSVQETAELSAATLEGLWQMIIGLRSPDELGGPIRIAQMSGEAAAAGIVTMLWFGAVLSINLGLINLFPVPMLDGGHLLFYAIEAVRGRPLGERAQDFGFKLGLALVLTLIVFVTWNDLGRLEFFEFLSSLVT